MTASGPTTKPLLVAHFLGNALLGEGVRPPVAASNLPHLRAYAFFCPHCGDIWARSVPLTSGGPWMNVVHPCGRHRSESILTPAGSLWLTWDEEHNLSLPRAALEREFRIHLTLYDSCQTPP